MHPADLLTCILPIALATFLHPESASGLLSRTHYNFFTSRYDALCTDQCDERKNYYFWCTTDQGWDYCSPSVNSDYKGMSCRADSPCENHGQTYKWCYLERGSWGYCGFVEPKMVLHRTRHGVLCMGACSYDNGYFWCTTTTEGNWGYCSPIPDVTYRNVPCSTAHDCGLHDKSYYWCYTGTSWDYCGVIEKNECEYQEYQAKKRRKRSNRQQNLMCREDTGNRIRTNFIYDQNANLADRPDLYNEVSDIVRKWNNDHLSNQARSNLVRTETLRIDLQGIINYENLRYYNLQIQINVRRNNRESTTVSLVLLPVNLPVRFPDRYVRHAFLESFSRRKRVIIKFATLGIGPSS